MKSTILFTFFISMAACALTQERNFDPDLCNKNAAYEAGRNDGATGYQMNSGFLNRCREDLRESAQGGYREGFTEGRKEFEKRMAAQKEQMAAEQKRMSAENEDDDDDKNESTPFSGPFPTNRTNVNINIGGIQTVGSGRSASRAWYCKVEAFTSTFEGFGPTKIEARRETLASCKKKYHEMHCDDISCERNR